MFPNSKIREFRSGPEQNITKATKHIEQTNNKHTQQNNKMKTRWENCKAEAEPEKRNNTTKEAVALD